MQLFILTQGEWKIKWEMRQNRREERQLEVLKAKNKVNFGKYSTRLLPTRRIV